MTSTAIYPGSFDPVTRGHEDIIRRGSRFVDRLIVAVAVNSAKAPLFDLEERLELLKVVTGDLDRVQIESFQGLLVDFARARGAHLVLRGLRAVSDFEFEFQMALMNRALHPQLETVFLMPDQNLTFLSSSFVREIAGLGGDVSDFVHPRVWEALVGKFGE